MSNIAQLNRLESELKALSERAEKLRRDPALAKELEAREAFLGLMSKYDLNERGVMSLLGFGDSDTGKKQQRRSRMVKTYINPHTQERIETKGGNHKQLKEWKAEHGAEEVASWELKEAS